MADSNKTVLVVDDSKLARMMIVAFIKDQKPEWSILEAANSMDALKIAQEQPVDAMSLDMNMPGIDGLELGVRLRALFPTAPIVLITANIQSAVRERAHDAGITFIAKPITEEKVAAFVHLVGS